MTVVPRLWYCALIPALLTDEGPKVEATGSGRDRKRLGDFNKKFDVQYYTYRSRPPPSALSLGSYSTFVFVLLAFSSALYLT